MYPPHVSVSNTGSKQAFERHSFNAKRKTIEKSRQNCRFQTSCFAQSNDLLYPIEEGSVPPAIKILSKDNATYFRFLSCQHSIVKKILTHPALTSCTTTRHCLNVSNDEGRTQSGDHSKNTIHVGATITGWKFNQLSNDGFYQAPLEYLSASSIANASLSFGTTRLMAWMPSHCDAPHFVLETGVMGCALDQSNKSVRAQGTITLAQRSDLILDVEYLDKYYDKSGYNDVYNRCLGYQQSLGWEHYQVPQCDMKPIIANSISYTFPTSSAEAFIEAAMDVADVWLSTCVAARPPSCPLPESSYRVGPYDARHKEVVCTDPGNQIAAKLFGKEATEDLIRLTIGNL